MPGETPFGNEAFQAAQDMDPILGGGLTQDSEGKTVPEGTPEKPTLGERFVANFREAQSTGTLAGAGKNFLTSRIATGTVPEGDELSIDMQAATEWAQRAHNEEIVRRISFEEMPSFTEADGFGQATLEALVATGGQVVGSMLTPETLLSMPVKAATAVGRFMTRVAPKIGPFGQRLTIAGVEGAATNVATDPAVQVLNIEAALQRDYDATQTALAAPLGFAGGAALRGAMDAAGGAYQSVRQRVARWTLDQMKEPAKAPEVAADGQSAADTMAVAAAANLASGTGSAVDAAKILRAKPELLDGSLAPNSSLVRDARGLTPLSDDAFRMVVNEVVPESYGAIVGRVFPDNPDMQKAAMDALVRAEPANATEAAILVERVRSAGLARSAEKAQTSLFGELFDGPESTVIEEMKIVARALELLKGDASLLSRAAANADRLEVAGSTIARDASKALAQENAAAADVAGKLYDTAGPVRDRLKEIALEVKDGKTALAEAARRLAAAVREQIAGNDAGRAARGAGDAAVATGGADGAAAGADAGAGTGRIAGGEPAAGRGSDLNDNTLFAALRRYQRAGQGESGFGEVSYAAHLGQGDPMGSDFLTTSNAWISRVDEMAASLGFRHPVIDNAYSGSHYRKYTIAIDKDGNIIPDGEKLLPGSKYNSVLFRFSNHPEPASRVKNGFGADFDYIPGSKFDDRAVFDAMEKARKKITGETSTPEFVPRLQNAAGQLPPQGLAPQGLAPTTGPRPEAVNLRQAITDLTETLDMPWRQGHMHIRGAQAEYGMSTGVGRTREHDDFEALTHEIGHHLEATVGDPLRVKAVQFAAELEKMAYPGTAPDQTLREGMAEFTRSYVTNRPFAEREAPGFAAEFRALLGREKPEFLAALDRAERAYSNYLHADPGDTIRANLATTYKPGGIKGIRREIKDKGLAGTIANWFENGYTALFDQFNPIHAAVRQLAEIHLANTGRRLDLKAVDDPYKLARMAVDAASAGHMDLMYGVHGYREADPSGPSLRSALVEALGEPNAFAKWNPEKAVHFGSYLVSRRALFEWDRFDAGLIPNPPTAEPRGYHARNVAESETANPAYASAAAKVYEWTTSLLRKRFDAGLITKDQFDEALKIQDYVPFYRDMTDKTKVAQGGGASAPNLENQVLTRRFEGSSRPIINPVESLMRQAYETNVAIRTNDVVKALYQLARDVGNSGGKIAELIPDHIVQATHVSVDQVILSAAKKLGMSPTDARLMADHVDNNLLGGGAMAELFKMGKIGTGGEPILFFWDGGKRRALRLADGEFGVSMFQAMSGMTEKMKDVWVNVVAKPSALFRAGVTTSPDFLVSNYIRDQVSAWVLTSEGFIPFVDGIRGAAAEVAQGDLARRYNMAGGITGGSNVAAMHEARLEKDFQALAKQGYLANRMTSVEGVLQLTELTETGTRLGVFKKAYDRSIAEGLSPYEAAVEAAFVARDYIDFGRHGSRAMAAQRLIPFLNASLQGLDKGARTMIVPWVKHMAGGTLTMADQRDLAVSKMAWAKVAALGMFSLGLRALYFDHEDYNEVSDYIRATHWVIPLGGNQILTIPKPFELGAIPNLFERAAEYWFQNDPKAFDKFRSGLFNILSPPNIFDAPAIKFYNEMRSGVDAFTGKDIIPDHLKGVAPYLQYTATTSAMSKQLGAAIGMSPAILDHTVVGLGASWGRGLLALYDAASGQKPAQGLDDAFFTRRFIKDVSRGSTSTTAFWDRMAAKTGTLAGQAQSYKILSDQGATKEAGELLATLSDRDRVYVTLAASNFDADTQRLHPLVRAQAAVGVVSKLRTEVAFGHVTSQGTNEPIPLTRTQRAEIDDTLSRIAMLEAANAFHAIGEPGWSQREARDLEPHYAVLRAISPDLADEMAARYARAKVYRGSAVAEAWPELRQRTLGEGSEAMLADLRGLVKADGYEMDGTRGRKAKKARIPIGGITVR